MPDSSPFSASIPDSAVQLLNQYIQASKKTPFFLQVCYEDGTLHQVPIQTNTSSDEQLKTSDCTEVREEIIPLTDCEQDILQLISESPERLTTQGVLSALDRSGKIHGESTVTKALANLCKNKGLLTNCRDSYGRGYGMPEWS